MSSESQPITPARFAAALPALPLSSLHAKAGEIHNSIAHLLSSNAQLAPFADPAGGSGEDYDEECARAVEENEDVIRRMRGRLELLKAEVEGRGSRWVWEGVDEGVVEVDPSKLSNNQREAHVNGVNGLVDQSNDDERDLENAGGASVIAQQAQGGEQTQTSGRYTDEELARRLREQMGEDDNDDNSEGMHL